MPQPQAEWVVAAWAAAIAQAPARVATRSADEAEPHQSCRLSRVVGSSWPAAAATGAIAYLAFGR